MFGKSRLGMMASLLRAAASGAFGVKAHDHRAEYFTKKGVRFKRTWSRKYPEQSHRQQMRRFRRAQGGPGIEFHPLHGWVPRGMEVGAPQ